MILDQNGAESLLGQGDMLFSPVGSSQAAAHPGRLHRRGRRSRQLTEFWARQGEPELRDDLLEEVEAEAPTAAASDDDGFDPDEDPLLAEAIELVVEMGTASTSMLQRRLRLGYTRAGRLIDMLERRGVISGYEGSKPRQVLDHRGRPAARAGGAGRRARGAARRGRAAPRAAPPAAAPTTSRRRAGSIDCGLAMPEIGATLREARMRARIDISEIEAETKIRAKYLRALENEEWGLLPGPAYVRSFLRTYAEALDLDAKLLLEEYKLRHERPSDHDLHADRRRRGARRPARAAAQRGPRRGGAAVRWSSACSSSRCWPPCGRSGTSPAADGGGTAATAPRTTTHDHDGAAPRPRPLGATGAEAGPRRAAQGGADARLASCRSCRRARVRCRLPGERAASCGSPGVSLQPGATSGAYRSRSSGCGWATATRGCASTASCAPWPTPARSRYAHHARARSSASRPTRPRAAADERARGHRRDRAPRS